MLLREEGLKVHRSDMISSCLKETVDETIQSDSSRTAVFGNVIKPNKTDVFAQEGSSVTLSCSFTASGGSDYLHWYRQYGRSKPEFLVLTYGNAKEAQVSAVDPRFTVEIEKKEQIHVYLEISSATVSDSAVYYCALVPTMTGNTSALYKNLLYERNTAAVFGNVIKPNKTDVFAQEGSSVTLSCSFSTSGGSDDLHWYRQYGRSKPEFLVLTFGNAKEAQVSAVDPRFTVEVEKKEQIHVHLKISSATVSDSAVYYCALRPTDGSVHTHSHGDTVVSQEGGRLGQGLVSGDDIEPDKNTETSKETDTVKLSCSYNTNSDYVFLYWYRQYPNGELQYLLRKGCNSQDKVDQYTKIQSAVEGDDVTINCTYQTGYSNPTLFWYQQKIGGACEI
ncbi:hypothetical protein F2P79_019585 [Pimephales promelas]|nr:hypothetical protein F2P79_019585 [Pimephales promelas]